MTGAATSDWLEAINWNADGLVAAIAQDAVTGQVLMQAWMNRDALAQTVARGEVVYWSRSGHVQKVREIRTDCDRDVLLLRVEQQGGIACHTGRAHCFFRRLDGGAWREVEPVLKSPAEIYA